MSKKRDKRILEELIEIRLRLDKLEKNSRGYSMNEPMPKFRSGDFFANLLR